SHHPGKPPRPAQRLVLFVACPVGGDIAGVADREELMRGRIAELIAYLEGGGFLSRDAVGIDAVDEADSYRVALGEVADNLEADIEVADYLEHPRAVHHRLRKLAEGNRSLGNKDVGLESGASGVGGGGGGGVAGGGADDGAGAFAKRL